MFSSMARHGIRKALCLGIPGIAVVLMVLTTVPTQAKQPALSLRAAMAAENLTDAIVVDATTPLPPVDGESVFVDGQFLVHAEAAVVERVSEMAKRGKPVVVIGPGYERLCSALGVYYSVAAEKTANGWVPIPSAASMLVLYPGQTANGRPVSKEVLIAGGNGATTKTAVREGAKALQQHQSAERESVRAKTEGSLAEAALTTDVGVWGTFAEFTWSSGDMWKDKGRLNVHSTYSLLLNDQSTTWDWQNAHLEMQMVPGQVCRGSTWHNDWADVLVNTRECQWRPDLTDWPRLMQYQPHTTPADGVQTVTLGTTAGTSGASVTASQTWTYPMPEITVEDSSDWYVDRFQVRHHIRTDSNNSNFTAMLSPGLNIRYPQNMGYLVLAEQYRCQWWRPNTWSHYSTTNWVRVFHMSC